MGTFLSIVEQLLSTMIGTSLNVILFPIANLLYIICYELYRVLAPMLYGLAQLITGDFMQALYQEAIGVKQGVINRALKNMLSFIDDIQNIFIVYSVCFIIITFLIGLMKKTVRASLSVETFFKSLIMMSVCVALSFGSGTIVSTLVDISGDISVVVYNAIGAGTKDVAEQLTNSLLTVNIMKDGNVRDFLELRDEMLITFDDSEEIEAGESSNAEKIVDNLFKTTDEALTGENMQLIETNTRVVISIIGGILFLMMPAIISTLINIYCLSFFITRIIELVVYSAFLPIAISDIYMNGLLGSHGAGYIKKIFTYAMQGVVLYAMLILSQKLIGAAGVHLLQGYSGTISNITDALSFMFGGLGRTILFFIVTIAIQVTMFSLAKKSQDISADIVE